MQGFERLFGGAPAGYPTETPGSQICITPQASVKMEAAGVTWENTPGHQATDSTVVMASNVVYGGLKDAYDPARAMLEQLKAEENWMTRDGDY